jgi:hypothetical protein
VIKSLQMGGVFTGGSSMPVESTATIDSFSSVLFKSVDIIVCPIGDNWYSAGKLYDWFINKSLITQ